MTSLSAGRFSTCKYREVLTKFLAKTTKFPGKGHFELAFREEFWQISYLKAQPYKPSFDDLSHEILSVMPKVAQNFFRILTIWNSEYVKGIIMGV